MNRVSDIVAKAVLAGLFLVAAITAPHRTGW
jgi:hypothetical protein